MYAYRKASIRTSQFPVLPPMAAAAAGSLSVDNNAFLYVTFLLIGTFIASRD